jgi:hypothetical protein
MIPYNRPKSQLERDFKPGLSLAKVNAIFIFVYLVKVVFIQVD